MVSLQGVTKRFGETTVLQDINLEAAKGEFVSLVGPSGCGKSTVLKMIAGLYSCSEGSVVVDGMHPTNAREEMSFIFQEANLLPWRRARGNIELPLMLRDVERRKRREVVQQMLDLVGLSHAGNRFPWQLSGGMKMRVSIARALTLAPRVLLLDEPFGALDEMTRDTLNEDLLQIHARDNWTAFFVTHSASEAVFLSDRVAVMSANPGQIAKMIPIDLGKTRDAALREEPRYLNYVAEVSEAIRSTHHPTVPTAS